MSKARGLRGAFGQDRVWVTVNTRRVSRRRTNDGVVGDRSLHHTMDAC